MRSCWLPAALSTEVAVPGARPTAVRMLGERLVVFRSLSGRLGVLGEQCVHAAASLAFGRVEMDGLRCSGHGWMYDLEGRCVEIPGDPPDSRFKDRVRQRACPCEESGGVVWTYLGPWSEMRPFVEPDWADVPVNQLRVTRESESRPYLEATNPEVAARYVAEANGLLGFGPQMELQPHRDAFLGSLRAPHILRRDEGGANALTIWVPADDKATRVWSVAWSVDGPLTAAER